MRQKIAELGRDLLLLARTRSWEGFRDSRGYYACRQIFLYGIIGGGCATLDYLFYILLSRSYDWYPLIFQIVDFFRELLHLDKESIILLYRAHWNLYFPHFVSCSIGIFCSFFLNARFNFKRSDNLRIRALKFLSIGYSGLLLSALILRVGTVLFHYPDWIVKAFAIFFVAALQFLLNKFITFNKTTPATEEGETPAADTPTKR